MDRQRQMLLTELVSRELKNGKMPRFIGSGRDYSGFCFDEIEEEVVAQVAAVLYRSRNITPSRVPNEARGIVRGGSLSEYSEFI